MRGSTVLGGGILVGIFALWITSLAIGYDIIADVAPGRAGLGPTSAHWLGTDHLGRDVFWRAVTASEAFVGPGLLACLVAAGIGLPVGGAAGWLGGAAASMLRYLSSVIAALPRFVLVLLVCAIYGDRPVVLALATGLSYAPMLGEAIFTRITAMRGEGFVRAALAHGLTPGRILLHELLWVNCRQLIIRHLLYLFGYFLVLETTLSYIGGFGVEEPQPSWGNMLAFEFGISNGNALAWLVPAGAIWLTVVGIALTAEGIREGQRG